MCMKKIVLLGGSGFIGSKLAIALSENNQVLVVDRFISIELSERDNIQYKIADFTDPKLEMDFIDDADVVVHLISTLLPDDGTNQLQEDICKNVFPTIRLLERIKNTSAELVFLSSGGTVYGESRGRPNIEDDSLNALCRYALIKIIIEETIKMYGHQNGTRYKILRLGNPYGYNINSERRQGVIPIFIEKIAKGEKITLWGDGTNQRDFIYIDDVIQAIKKIIALPQTHLITNIGSGRSYSTIDILRMIEMKMKEYSPVNINHEVARKCDIKNNLLDISRLQNLAQWRPEISIEDGIDRVLKEYLSHRVN